MRCPGVPCATVWPNTSTSENVVFVMTADSRALLLARLVSVMVMGGHPHYVPTIERYWGPFGSDPKNEQVG